MDRGGWQADELPGYEKQELALPAEGDGELVATLVRRTPKQGEGPALGAVLYLHGYVDYFFQTHLADALSSAGFAFYALDLRRYGRSLRPANVPCQFAHASDYFAEIDWALDEIRHELGLPISIVAHSTGALIASIYAKRGAHRSALHALVLNSPFFEFRAHSAERAALALVVRLGRVSPELPAPVALSPIYGMTLHKSKNGEWDYDLNKKPLSGWGVKSGWIAAIAEAHGELQAGLELALPCLVQRSKDSHRPGRRVEPRDHSADLVLDVAHMSKFAPCLGQQVKVEVFEGGLHDLTLSRHEVRQRVLSSTTEFLKSTLPRPSPGA